MEEQVQKLRIDVSIILINYYSTELLRSCLDSIYKYTHEINYEIIVVDNGSVTGELENLIAIFLGIKLIKNESNKGFGAANNQGVKIAKGKYVLFLNNDTILIDNAIKKVFDYAESIDEKSIIGCKLLNEDRSVQKSVYDFPTLLNVFTSNFFLYLLFPKSKYFNKYHLMNRGISEVTNVDVVTGAFIFLRRKTFLDLSEFDERFFFYMEDTDLCYRHKKNNGKIIYYPESSIIHLKGKSAKGESWFKNKNRSISTVKYFQKHFQVPEFYLSIIIHHLGLLIRSPLFIFSGVLSFNKDLIKRGLFSILLFFIYPSNQFKN